jgi:hypothetical protein
LRKINRIYTYYLRKIGKCEDDFPIDIRGNIGEVESEDVLIYQSGLLRQRLDLHFQFNNRIIILAMVLLCILFAVGVYLTIHYRDEPPVMGGIFAGTFISLLSIVKRKRKWKK